MQNISPQIELATNTKIIPKKESKYGIKENGKKDTGRPTVYDPIETLEKVEEYIQKCEDEWERFVTGSYESGEKYSERLKVKLPTLTGLSLHLGVREETINQWRKEDDKKDFSVAIDKIIAIQKERLVNNALSETYNPGFVKFLLSVNHGMKETAQETKVSFNINGISISIDKSEDEIAKENAIEI